jgi:hypothetical protein
MGLAHFADLDPRFARPIAAAEQTPEAIARLLTHEGAPAVCYCLSEDRTLDERELPLRDALHRVVGAGMGTFLSCVPGRLAYFESEERGARYILVRAAV